MVVYAGGAAPGGWRRIANEAAFDYMRDARGLKYRDEAGLAMVVHAGGAALVVSTAGVGGEHNPYGSYGCKFAVTHAMSALVPSLARTTSRQAHLAVRRAVAGRRRVEAKLQQHRVCELVVEADHRLAAFERADGGAYLGRGPSKWWRGEHVGY